MNNEQEYAWLHAHNPLLIPYSHFNWVILDNDARNRISPLHQGLARISASRLRGSIEIGFRAACTAKDAFERSIRD